MFYNGQANYFAHIVSLYDRQRVYSYVVDFARLALQFANGQDHTNVRAELKSRLFTAATSLSRFDLAHSSLVSMTDKAIQHASLRRLVERMAERGETSSLIALPFPGMQDAVDDVLAQRCYSTHDVGSRSTPWHQILYAWRVAHNDYRGAAAILLDRLRKLQIAGEGDKIAAGDDLLDTPVTRTYLMLINTLSCVDPKQAWIAVEDASRKPITVQHMEQPEANGDEVVMQSVENSGMNGHNASKGQNQIDLLLQKGLAKEEIPWRKVISLVDIRKQYQEELDRISAIQNNQFEFGAIGEDDDEAMDEL
jgi:nuclear pore complex protein Nup160